MYIDNLYNINQQVVYFATANTTSRGTIKKIICSIDELNAISISYHILDNSKLYPYHCRLINERDIVCSTTLLKEVILHDFGPRGIAAEGDVVIDSLNNVLKIESDGSLERTEYSMYPCFRYGCTKWNCEGYCQAGGIPYHYCTERIEFVNTHFKPVEEGDHF